MSTHKKIPFSAKNAVTEVIFYLYKTKIYAANPKNAQKNAQMHKNDICTQICYYK